jgi:DNA-binding transcriptional regulator YiaG
MKKPKWTPERIRNLRGELTQTQFATRISESLDATAVCRWERGHCVPSPLYCERLDAVEKAWLDAVEVEKAWLDADIEKWGIQNETRS